MGKTIDVDEDYLEHPLFPVEEGDSPPDISFIHITRWERGKQYWGKCLPSHELQTVEQIAELYGGGEYVLVARTASKVTPGIPARISKQRKITIPGKPKPMSDDPTEEEENGGKKVIHQQQAANGLMGGADGILLAILNMNATAQQAAEARAERAAKEAADASSRFMMMFMELMKGNKSDASQMTQMMMQMSQAQNQSMMTMVTAMMSARGGGPEEMSKMVELLKGLGLNMGSKKEDDEKGGFSMEDLPTMIENVADIATAAAELRRGPTPPNSQPPQITPGDNSAAGIAAAMGLKQ